MPDVPLSQRIEHKVHSIVTQVCLLVLTILVAGTVGCLPGQGHHDPGAQQLDNQLVLFCWCYGLCFALLVLDFLLC